MTTYVRLEEEIGAEREICEYLDKELELRHCLRGEIVESGLSSATLATGEVLTQHVEFLKTENYGTVLFLDKMVQTCDLPELEASFHETMVHVPLIEHHDPRRILVLGGGDGAIVREVVKHDNVEQCVLVELDNNIIELSKKHLPNCARVFLEDEPRLQIHYQDCIGYLDDAAEPDSFDVVIVDLVDVLDADKRATRQALYSRDFYGAIKRALKPDGILITHVGGLLHTEKQVNREVFWEFAEVFPNARPLSVYVPIFFLEWLFCVAAKDTNFSWNSFGPDQLDRLSRVSGRTVFYDLTFHRGVFQENFQVRDIVAPKR